MGDGDDSGGGRSGYDIGRVALPFGGFCNEGVVAKDFFQLKK